MLKINLIDPTKSDIAYKIITFPDGEQHLVLNKELDRKEEYLVDCRITSADDLFILLQLGQILDTAKVKWDLTISYLMTQRMDRIMAWGEAMSLEIVANCINQLHYQQVIIFEPHSERTLQLINRSIEPQIGINLFLSKFHNKNVIVCFPDRGAFQRYCNVSKSYITFKKKRDITTGKILSLEQDMSCTSIDFNQTYTRIILLDDLCDGGGTFHLTYHELRKKWTEIPIDIMVTHMVNPKGLENLAKTFDQVYITNSYKDWDVTKYPNVILTKLL